MCKKLQSRFPPVWLLHCADQLAGSLHLLPLLALVHLDQLQYQVVRDEGGGKLPAGTEKKISKQF